MSTSTIHKHFEQTELNKLLKENKKLKRKLDIVANSPVYFLALTCNSIEISLNKVISRAFSSCVGKTTLISHFQDFKITSQKVLIEKSKLFDSNWYKKQLPQDSLQKDEDLLEHYLKVGYLKNLSPCPYFDSTYVLSQLKDRSIQISGINPLVIYLKSWFELKLEPNVLFDTKHVLKQITDCVISSTNKVFFSNTNPLSWYLEQSCAAELSTSPFFDANYYSSMYIKQSSTMRSDYRSSWCHFMEIGRFLMARPNPCFSPKYYLEQEKQIKINDSTLLLQHYLANKRGEEIRPHPKFESNRPFNSLTALSQEVEQEIESESSSKIIFQKYIESGLHMDIDFDFYEKLINVISGNKKIIILVGHEASLTGAPMVLLSLAQYFSKQNFACLAILRRGGELLSLYKESCLVGLFENEKDDGIRLEALLRYIKTHIPADKLAGAIVNTAENVYIQSLLKANGIKMITLVHEVADSYKQEYFDELCDCSELLVFSSEFTHKQALAKSNLDRTPVKIRPQGLISQIQAANPIHISKTIIRKELGLSENSFLILSCASLDLRKGIDIYAQIIIKVFKNLQKMELSKTAKEIHFVWIGGGSKDVHTPFYFTEWDLRQSGLVKNVHFIEPRYPLDSWMQGADVFLLPSRQDPLPCVAMDAMAAGLPVVAFENAGGITEYLETGAGNIINYGDTEAVANALLSYYFNEEARLKAGTIGQNVAKEKFSFVEYSEFIKGALACLL